jgi:hypothetical protein
MKKALKHVKHVFSSSSSSRNTNSHYWQHAALTYCGLRPLCLFGTGPHSWATVLHKPQVIRSWTMMTSPSIRRRSWRGWSHSEFESSFTLVFTMWTYSRKGRWTPTSHTLLHRWLEFCDEILEKFTTGGGDPTDQKHDGGIGMRSGDVSFLQRLTNRHHQQPLQSPWLWTWCLNVAKI